MDMSMPTLQDMPQNLNPEALLAFFRQNPQLLRQLHHVAPDLAKALETRDVVQVRTAVMMYQMQHHKQIWERKQEMDALEREPDSLENQRKIEEMIKQKGIIENYELAMEEAPEVFGRVHMLYIDVEVQGHRVKAFVDSGAQSTIMSAKCAEECGLHNLIDVRYAGEARGVGTCKILGRVHLANLKVGGSFFGCSFTILERNDVDLLFGLDMLKRHQCLIDLRENCLHIGSGNVKVPFLAEKDLPDSAKEKQNDMEPVGELPPPNAAAEDGKPPAAASDPPAPPAPADLQIEKVQQLVSLGIPREQATLALESVGGDVDQAAAFFFAQMEV